MKRIALTIAMTLIMSSIGYAQFTIGPKVGLNLSTIRYNSDTNDFFKYRMGANMGVFGKYTINRLFDIQTEIMYSQQGYKLDMSDVALFDYNGTKYYSPDVKILTHNLNIPLLLKSNMLFLPGLYVEIGPQVGFFLKDSYSSKDKELEEELNDADINFKTADFQIIGGLGFDIGKKVSVNARYCHALTSIYEAGFKNRVFQFSLAYNLFNF